MSMSKMSRLSIIAIKDTDLRGVNKLLLPLLQTVIAVKASLYFTIRKRTVLMLHIRMCSKSPIS